MNIWNGLEDTRAGLAAALAFVDEFNDVVQEESMVLDDDVLSEDLVRVVEEVLEGTVPGASKSSRKTTTPAMKASTAYYKRRKEEMKQLRTEVHELEKQLLQLKGEDTVEPESFFDDNDDDTEIISEHDALSYVWKEIADRQRKERRRVETENTRLRTLIQSQSRISQSLERIVKRQSQEEIPIPIPRPISSQWRATWIDKTMLFEQLTPSLTSLFAQTDSVVNDPRLYSLVQSLREINVMHDEKTEMPTLHILDARLIPFKPAFVADVMWEFFRQPPQTAGRFVHETLDYCSEDVVKKELHINVHGSDGAFEFRVVVVTQRFVQADRVVIVSASLLQPHIVCNAYVQDIALRSVDWMMVERPRNSSVSQQASQMLFRRISTPVVLRQIPNPERQIQILLDHISDKASKHLEHAMRHMDTMLLKHATEHQ